MAAGSSSRVLQNVHKNIFCTPTLGTFHLAPGPNPKTSPAPGFEKGLHIVPVLERSSPDG